MLGLTDPDAEEDGRDGEADTVDLGHVAGLGGVEVVDYLYVVVVVVVVILIPGVVIAEDDGRQDAGAKNGSALEYRPFDEWGWGEGSLLNGENREE